MSAVEFIEFYRKALGLGTEDFELFLGAANSPLPSTFRVTPTSDRAAILRRLERYSFLTKVGYLDDVYTFSLKEKTPEYKEFIQFLVAQSNTGNIQRQEIVSMLPHMFLDLKSDSRVLETCASPGSKTKQLLEVVKTGLVISNDKSPSRANILITEASKKASTSFIVTMADASQLPNMDAKFDRICCDVPCSSDGTMRKNRQVYDRWTLGASTGICNLQYRILERALRLLADDGLLVYSTCSLSPIENEYVVNRILQKGEHELVLDASKIQYVRDGPSKVVVWKGVCKFSHGDYSFENSELSKCIRILPHDQDTGGFFIAVLRKKSDGSPSSPENPSACRTSVKQPANAGFHDVPQDILEKIFASFGAPRDEDIHFIAPTTSYKSIYAVSNTAYRFIRGNPRLKISHAGVKAFVKTDLDNNSYRVKGSCLEQVFAEPAIWGTEEDLKLLLESRVVDARLLSFQAKGHFSMGIRGLRYKFCGFGSSAKVFLYVDDDHRRALADLYIKE